MTNPSDATDDSDQPEEDIDESTAYAEDTPLTWVFGDHPEPRMIATFLSERDRDLNVATIKDISGLSRGAIYNHLDELVEYGIIEETREMGGGQLYQLNGDSEYAKLLHKIEDKLLEEWYQSHDPESSQEGSGVDIGRVERGEIEDIEKPYGDGTPLTEILGNHPEVKIVATLLSEHTNDINVTDIARLADVSRTDVYDHLETLQEYDLVKQPRKVGRSKMYTVDASKASVQLIHKLEDQLLKNWYSSKGSRQKPGRQKPGANN